MKTFLIFLSVICLGQLANAQGFRYFITDTVTPRLVYLKMKGEEKLWPRKLCAQWYFTKDRQLTEYLEEKVFKVAFDDVNWKQMPGLADVGVFFCFNKSLQIDYVHFIINTESSRLSHNELLDLEKNFVKYAHLMKKVNVADFGYAENSEQFCNGIGRVWLIWKKSSLWNEK